MEKDAPAQQPKTLDYRSASEDRAQRNDQLQRRATRIVAAVFSVIFAAAAVYFSFAAMNARRGRDPYPIEVVVLAAVGSILCFLVASGLFGSRGKRRA